MDPGHRHQLRFILAASGATRPVGRASTLGDESRMKSWASFHLAFMEDRFDHPGDKTMSADGNKR
jgi:hypothetical protein